MKEKALCQSKSCELLKVRQKVRIQHDNPIEFTSGKRLHGKFEVVIYGMRIKLEQLSKPPMYQVDNDSNDAYTRNHYKLPVIKKETIHKGTKALLHDRYTW